MRWLMAVLLYFCADHGAWSQGITLRYAQAYSALRSIFALPLLVAEREGYFTRSFWPTWSAVELTPGFRRSRSEIETPVLTEIELNESPLCTM